MHFSRIDPGQPPVVDAVQPDVMPGGHQLREEPGKPADPAQQDEERRSGAVVVQGREHAVGAVWLGTVVVGEDDVPRLGAYRVDRDAYWVLCRHEGNRLHVSAAGRSSARKMVCAIIR
jgi:hypothetical protein